MTQTPLFPEPPTEPPKGPAPEPPPTDERSNIQRAMSVPSAEARIRDLEAANSDLHSAVVRLTFALATERAYNSNNTGDNAARRKLAWTGLTPREQTEVKRMQRHEEA